MRPLRIALVLHDLPLPFGSATGRWYYVLLRGLVERGHDVTAFAASGRPDEIAEAHALFPGPRYRLHCYPPTGRGLRATLRAVGRPRSYPFDDAFQRDLDATVARGVDVLHLEELWSGWVGLRHAHLAVMSLHYLVAVDLGDAPRATLRDRLRDRAARRAERHLVRRYSTIRTLTPQLSAHVRRINPRADVHTIPLGLDLARYPFDGDGAARDRPTVALIGSFAWGPTRSAGERLLSRLWPEIARRVPGARLQIVGRCADAIVPDGPPPNVSVHADVPDAIPYFRGADVLLYAPERGSGMKVKVLEAFALGTAVVTTADGVEGLAAIDGVHAGVCDDDAGLIDRCVALLTDPLRARRQRHAARALVEATCGPDVTLDAIEEVHAAVVARRGARHDGRRGPADHVIADV
jgi:glycosyltransferase involved in cell wall biosynthesis